MLCPYSVLEIKYDFKVVIKRENLKYVRSGYLQFYQIEYIYTSFFLFKSYHCMAIE